MLCRYVDLTVGVKIHDTTSVATNYSCAPRWKVYNETRSYGGVRLRQMSTLQECLDECVEDADCVAVDWNYVEQTCLVHNVKRKRHNSENVTQYQVIRTCRSGSTVYCIALLGSIVSHEQVVAPIIGILSMLKVHQVAPNVHTRQINFILFGAGLRDSMQAPETVKFGI